MIPPNPPESNCLVLPIVGLNDLCRGTLHPSQELSPRFSSLENMNPSIPTSFLDNAPSTSSHRSPPSPSPFLSASLTQVAHFNPGCPESAICSLRFRADPDSPGSKLESFSDFIAMDFFIFFYIEIRPKKFSIYFFSLLVTRRLFVCFLPSRTPSQEDQDRRASLISESTVSFIRFLTFTSLDLSPTIIDPQFWYVFFIRKLYFLRMKLALKTQIGYFLHLFSKKTSRIMINGS